MTRNANIKWLIRFGVTAFWLLVLGDWIPAFPSLIDAEVWLTNHFADPMLLAFACGLMCVVPGSSALRADFRADRPAGQAGRWLIRLIIAGFFGATLAGLIPAFSALIDLEVWLANHFADPMLFCLSTGMMAMLLASPRLWADLFRFIPARSAHSATAALAPEPDFLYAPDAAVTEGVFAPVPEAVVAPDVAADSDAAPLPEPWELTPDLLVSDSFVEDAPESVVVPDAALPEETVLPEGERAEPEEIVGNTPDAPAEVVSPDDIPDADILPGAETVAPPDIPVVAEPAALLAPEEDTPVRPEPWELTPDTMVVDGELPVPGPAAEPEVLPDADVLPEVAPVAVPDVVVTDAFVAEPDIPAAADPVAEDEVLSAPDVVPASEAVPDSVPEIVPTVQYAPKVDAPAKPEPWELTPDVVVEPQDQTVDAPVPDAVPEVPVLAVAGSDTAPDEVRDAGDAEIAPDALPVPADMAEEPLAETAAEPNVPVSEISDPEPAGRTPEIEVLSEIGPEFVLSPDVQSITDALEPPEQSGDAEIVPLFAQPETLPDVPDDSEHLRPEDIRLQDSADEAPELSADDDAAEPDLSFVEAGASLSPDLTVDGDPIVEQLAALGESAPLLGRDPLPGVDAPGLKGDGPAYPSALYAHWDTVGSFAAWQVAWLWNDWEPTDEDMADPRVMTSYIRLEGNLESGKIRDVTPSGKSWKYVEIPRQSLVDYALASGERPKFLFAEKRGWMAAQLHTLQGGDVALSELKDFMVYSEVKLTMYKILRAINSDVVAAEVRAAMQKGLCEGVARRVSGGVTYGYARIPRYLWFLLKIDWLGNLSGHGMQYTGLMVKFKNGYLDMPGGDTPSSIAAYGEIERYVRDAGDPGNPTRRGGRAAS